MRTQQITLLLACLGLFFTAAPLHAKEPEANTGKAPKKEAAAKKMGKTVRGQVNRVEITDGTRILHIGLGDKTKMYKTTEATKFLVLGKQGTLDDLKHGMHAALLSAFESGSATEKPKTLIYLVADTDRAKLKSIRSWDTFEEQWAKLGEATEAGADSTQP